MWQEIILIIIAVIVMVCVGYKLYRFFTKPYSPCDDCIGCSLKDQVKDEGDDCEKIRTESKNNYT